MNKVFGFDLLEQQIVDFVVGEYDCLRNDKHDVVGDTEIERLFFLATKMRIFLNASEIQYMQIAANEEEENKILERIHFSGLVCRPQAQIDQWRVDFLFRAFDWKNRTGPWRKIIVECDGHDFHERTKEQAARDRSRDRQAQIGNIPVLRFTGSEIWRDPWGCAEQFLDLAVGDWGRP